jgi:hypothetical protein
MFRQGLARLERRPQRTPARPQASCSQWSLKNTHPPPRSNRPRLELHHSQIQRPRGTERTRELPLFAFDGALQRAGRSVAALSLR